MRVAEDGDRQVQGTVRTVPDCPKKTSESEGVHVAAVSKVHPQRPGADLKYAVGEDPDLKVRLKMMNDVYLRLKISSCVIAQVFVFKEKDLQVADEFGPQWTELFESAVVVLLVEDCPRARLWQAVWARAQRWYFYAAQSRLLEGASFDAYAVLMGHEKHPDEDVLKAEYCYSIAELDDKVSRTVGSRRRWRAKQLKRSLSGADRRGASPVRDGQSSR